MKIRQGNIYWLNRCPPLDGNTEKRRPVVVVSTKDQIARNQIVVIACTASATSLDPTRIELPNSRDIPQTKSGLHKPCWLIPRWLLSVDSNRLEEADYVGYLAGAKLRDVLASIPSA